MRLLAALLLLCTPALAECERNCVAKADPVPNASGYDLLVNGEVMANFFAPVVDFREHPDLWSEEPFVASWVAVNSAGRSANPSNEVWFNRSCVEHTGEIIDHGEWQEVVGCERECCAGCLRELPQRYAECAHGTAS